MLPEPSKYIIYPSVVKADVTSTMKILPAERAFLLFDGEEYKLRLIAVNGDETSYHRPTSHQYITAVAKDGVLCFDWTFEGEGEHLITLYYNDKPLQDFVIYSLCEDLYALKPLRGDLHGHSYRSDGVQDPAAVAGHYREMGYDFFALTDHNRYYPGGEIDETYAGVKLGITRVLGEEIHGPGSVVHIVHVGGKSSVADLYVHHYDDFVKEIEEKYLPRVPANVPEKYHDRYAKAMWAVDRVHEAGGLAIFPHPYWRTAAKCYNVNDEFTRILLESGMFDAFELVGGMPPMGINRCLAIWGEVRATGVNIPLVGSSDVHALRDAHFPNNFTVCFATENENDAIMAAVKAGLSVAVEATGTEYERHYRCYGSLRLVSYAQFLLSHYFPRLQRVCQGEGIAMRAYAMGGTDQALIEGQVALTEQYKDCFFGITEPPMPDADMRAFEDKWREVQKNGPETKGSAIFLGLSGPRQL